MESLLDNLSLENEQHCCHRRMDNPLNMDSSHSCDQVLALTPGAYQIIRERGMSHTPFPMFLVFLAIIDYRTHSAAAQDNHYWAYVPTPPKL